MQYKQHGIFHHTINHNTLTTLCEGVITNVLPNNYNALNATVKRFRLL